MVRGAGLIVTAHFVTCPNGQLALLYEDGSVFVVLLPGVFSW